MDVLRRLFGSGENGDRDAPRESATADAPGHYRGRHYTEWVSEVKRLKREDKLAEADTLLLALIDAVEAEAAAEDAPAIAPWYYRHLAIVRRKRGDYAGEIEVLDRYDAAQAKACEAVGVDWNGDDLTGKRRDKARKLLAKSKM